MAHRIRIARHGSRRGSKRFPVRNHLRTVPYNRTEADLALAEFEAEVHYQQVVAEEKRRLAEAAEHVDRIADTLEMEDAQRREFEATNAIAAGVLDEDAIEARRRALRDIHRLRLREAGVRFEAEHGPWVGGF